MLQQCVFIADDQREEVDQGEDHPKKGQSQQQIVQSPRPSLDQQIQIDEQPRQQQEGGDPGDRRLPDIPAEALEKVGRRPALLAAQFFRRIAQPRQRGSAGDHRQTAQYKQQIDDRQVKHQL